MASTPAEAGPYLEEMEVLYTWGFPTELLPRARRLRWIQVMGAGVNAFLDAPFPPKVILTRVEEVFGPWMAEYTLGWLLWGTQHTEAFRAAQRARQWEPVNPTLLRGRTLGVVGLGSIGRAIARAARAFGMGVIGLNRSGRRVPEAERVFRRTGLRELLHASDYVVLALPLTPETRGIVGEAELRAMRAGAWLVNVGRGGLVQEDALVRALHERWLGGAVLDVFAEEPLPPDHPFWAMPNVVVTPHVSGPNVPEEIAPVFNENLQRFLGGRALRGRVDLRRGY
ncbi:MAG TPA: D-2-hydroxyacid dehydrogenase [Methylomirabilota bacterium]|nr:D-2-hydroxyacid dehydrogenase [Methylomirabilota bacterium]